MVHQLVLRLEGFLNSSTLSPVAGMINILWPAYMVHGQVVHDVVESVKHLVALLLGVLVDPLAGHLLLDGLAHIPVVGSHVPVAHVGVVVAGGVVQAAERVSTSRRRVQTRREHRVGRVAAGTK